MPPITRSKNLSQPKRNSPPKKKSPPRISSKGASKSEARVGSYILIKDQFRFYIEKDGTRIFLNDVFKLEVYHDLSLKYGNDVTTINLLYYGGHYIMDVHTTGISIHWVMSSIEFHAIKNFLDSFLTMEKPQEEINYDLIDFSAL